MKASMERVHRLCAHPLFLEQTALLAEDEKDRVFCRHSMEHLLDVARLMYIYSLEDDSKLDRELIYAAALLHDIGRHEQLLHGTPHQEAGVGIAETILPECGFSSREIQEISSAISAHRSPREAARDSLSDYLYRADKQSRSCFCCPAANDCSWPAEKKNSRIDY